MLLNEPFQVMKELELEIGGLRPISIHKMALGIGPNNVEESRYGLDNRGKFTERNKKGIPYD